MLGWNQATQRGVPSSHRVDLGREGEEEAGDCFGLWDYIDIFGYHTGSTFGIGFDFHTGTRFIVFSKYWTGRGFGIGDEFSFGVKLGTGDRTTGTPDAEMGVDSGQVPKQDMEIGEEIPTSKKPRTIGGLEVCVLGNGKDSWLDKEHEEPDDPIDENDLSDTEHDIRGDVKDIKREPFVLPEPASVVPKHVAYGTRSGEVIDKEATRQGRMVELGNMMDHRVFEVVKIKEVRHIKKVKAKWLQDWKGSKVKARLVAMQIAWDTREDVHAGTPPLAAIRAVIAMAASRPGVLRGRPRKIGIYDITAAFIHALIDELMVILPPKGIVQDDEGLLLLKALYGTRKASKLWQQLYTKIFGDHGWRRSLIFPASFYNQEEHMGMSCHGDDFIAEGEDSGLDKLTEVMENNFESKVLARIGPGCARSGDFLKRTIRWYDDEKMFTWSGDKRLIEGVVQSLGLENAKGSDIPGGKTTAVRNSDEDLDVSSRGFLKSINGNFGYIALDRPDIQYSVKTVKKEESLATNGTMARAKKVARYLVSYPELEWCFPLGEPIKHVEAIADSDWAGDHIERKSTSCVVLRLGPYTLETSSVTQVVIALSSGEAEFYAANRAAAAGIQMKQFMVEMGVAVNLRVWSDSSACRGMMCRLGSGKVKHLHIRSLWTQQKLRDGEFELKKADTLDNVADVGTKHLSAERIAFLLDRLGLRRSRGLQVAVLGATSLPTARAEGEEVESQAGFSLRVIVFIVILTLLVENILCRWWRKPSTS